MFGPGGCQVFQDGQSKKEIRFQRELGCKIASCVRIIKACEGFQQCITQVDQLLSLRFLNLDFLGRELELALIGFKLV